MPPDDDEYLVSKTHDFKVTLRVKKIGEFKSSEAEKEAKAFRLGVAMQAEFDEYYPIVRTAFHAFQDCNFHSGAHILELVSRMMKGGVHTTYAVEVNGLSSSYTTPGPAYEHFDTARAENVKEARMIVTFWRNEAAVATDDYLLSYLARRIKDGQEMYCDTL